MVARITFDFETRSACDLKKAGAWEYSAHPSTEVLCLWFCTRQGRTHCWLPGDPEPEWLRPQIAAGAVFEAHNVLFEKGVWRHIMVPKYGFPPIPFEQWHDTMAACGRRALPLDLNDASRLLALPTVKDAEGHKAMLAICKPHKTRGFNNDQALRERVIAYGEKDVLAQAALGKRLGPLEPREREFWLLNQTMNERGMAIDLAFAADCQAVYDAAVAPLAVAFEEKVGIKPRSPKVLAAINAKLQAAGSAARFENMQKETVAEALEDWDLPDDVREIVEMRSALTSASVAKLAAMRNCTGADGRARGLLQYHAATTGRDGGRLLQPTNFPRGTVEMGKDADGKKIVPMEFLVPTIQARDVDLIGMVLADNEKNVSEPLRHLVAPVSAVTSALRHCLVAAPGHVLNAGDYSTIEARVVLAIAGQHDRLKLMAEGGDPYCDLASIVLGRPITKAENPRERQDIGKPTVLGCGFQMGAPKFHAKYMKKAPFEEAQKCVDVYRKEWAPEVPKLWYGLQEAAVKCVWDRRPQEFRGIVYQIEDQWLTCRLHSGRKLYYFDPRKEQKEMPWSTPDDPDIRASWTYIAKKTGRLVRVSAYGGLLTENVVQATARDIMFDRAVILEQEGFGLVLNVYDENVAEVPESRSNPKLMEQIMISAGTDIAWVRELGIPVGAEAWAGKRYKK
jgi:DNA polymerase bacteriophage-type